MKKTFIVLAICWFGIPNLYCQTEAEAMEALGTVSTIEDLRTLKSAFPEWEISLNRIPAFGPLKVSDITALSIGEIHKVRTDENIVLIDKLLSREKVTYMKVLYIYISGEDRTIAEIDSIRSLIMTEYNDGADIEGLVEKYNEDGNLKGLDWFSEWMVVDEFYKGVIGSQKDEIFTVDVPDRKWYYVVYKTHDDIQDNETFTARIEIISTL